MTPFERILPIKKSTCAAQQILDSIRRGEYLVGSTLPPERVLASEMDTSRSSIREALSILHGLEIVATRPGDGTYVRRLVTDENIMKQAQAFVRETEDLIQVWEARAQIETALVLLSVARRNARTLQEPAEALGLMREAVDKKDVIAYRIANEKFHLSIAKMSGNTPLISALHSLLQVTTNHILDEISSQYITSSMRTSLKKHEAIFDAIVDKDKEAATSAVEFHFEDLERHFRKRLNELRSSKDPFLSRSDPAKESIACKRSIVG